MIGRGGERLFVIGGRFLQPVEIQHHVAAIIKRLRMVGFQRDRLAEIGDGFGEPPDLPQQAAAPAPCRGERRLQCKSAVIARERRIAPVEIAQREGASDKGGRKIGPQREHRLIARKRVLEPLEQPQRAGAVIKRLYVIGFDGKGVFEAR